MWAGEEKSLVVACFIIEIKEEFQSLHNALPMDLKRGDEPVIPDTADALREKIQAAKDIINEGLLMDRGKHS